MGAEQDFQQAVERDRNQRRPAEVKSSPANAVKIDGGFMEGGGQVLRISLTCSAITGRPIEIVKIRSGRSSPGLRNQHLAGAKLVAAICSGELSQCRVGSESLHLTPSSTSAHETKGSGNGEYVANPRSAGSLTLLAQAALPCAGLSNGVVA